MATRTVDLGQVVGPAGPNTVSTSTTTALNGVLTGNGSTVGAKSIDTSTLTNDNDHIPTSGVVKSAIESITTRTNKQGVSDASNTISGLIWLYQNSVVTTCVFEISLKTAPVNYVDKNNERWFPIGKIANTNVFNLPVNTLSDLRDTVILGICPWVWSVKSTGLQAIFNMSIYAYYDGTDTQFVSHVAKSYFDTFNLVTIACNFTVPAW